MAVPTDRYVGKSIPRVEDWRLLRGQGKFLDDIRLPGVLHIAFVRSPHAHAIIKAVNSANAYACPGVVDVVTGRELKEHVEPLLADLSLEGYKAVPYPPLAWEKVCFTGQPVAAVLATTRYEAEDGADQVVVDYEPLPVVATAEAAVTSDSPQIHPECPGNLHYEEIFSAGDVDTALRQAHVVIRKSFRFGRCTGVPMENRGTLAQYDEATGNLTVWSSTQSPHLMRTGLAKALRLPEHLIRVIVPDVGGSFGMKIGLCVEEIVAASLAIRLRRPVKWIEDRREALSASVHARDFTLEVTVGADREGRLLAVEADVLGNMGAYSTWPLGAAFEMQGAVKSVVGIYKTPAYRYRGRAVCSNRCPSGAYRGVGLPIGVLAMERLLDMVAHACSIDPVEIRRRNLLDEEHLPQSNAAGWSFDSASFRTALERAVTAVDYEGLRQKQNEARKAGRYIGIGIAAFCDTCGAGSKGYRDRGIHQVPGYDSARVRMDPSGHVWASVSTCPHGQGHQTTYRQLIAERLCVPMEHISITFGDTALAPYGTGTFASKGAVSGSGSVILAANKVRTRLLKAAAKLLKSNPEDLETTEGKIALPGTIHSVSIAEAAETAWGIHPEHRLDEPGLDEQAVYDPPAWTFVNSVHVAVVEVDPLTGIVQVRQYLVVEDCGNMINPRIVDGQTCGSVAQGLGNALLEEIVYDEFGQLLTGSLMDYLIPSALDVPSIQIEHLVTPSPSIIGGTKGMAESGTVGAPAALANAIADALGPRGSGVTQVPMTPERVWSLLRSTDTKAAVR